MNSFIRLNTRYNLILSSFARLWVNNFTRRAKIFEVQRNLGERLLHSAFYVGKKPKKSFVWASVKKTLTAERVQKTSFFP